MNADHMIDYVLGQLEGPDRERLERTLHVRPGSRRPGRSRSSLAVHLLLDDGYAAEPPPGLTAPDPRPRRPVADAAPGRSSTTSRSGCRSGGPTSPWRPASSSPASSRCCRPIQRSRERMDQAGCGFNLQQLGKSLAQYATMHPSYPYPGSERADAHAGMFVALLHDAGLLQDLSVLDCPYNGPCNHPQRATCRAATSSSRSASTDPDRYQHLLCWDYAYNAGYRHASGRPGPLAVAPADGRSGGRRRTVARELRCGSSTATAPTTPAAARTCSTATAAVRFHPTRRVSPIDSDLYLNNQHELRPGLDVRDAVLVPSYSPIQGFDEVSPGRLTTDRGSRCPRMRGL